MSIPMAINYPVLPDRYLINKHEQKLNIYLWTGPGRRVSSGIITWSIWNQIWLKLNTLKPWLKSRGFNSLWPSDAILQHKYGSTLVQGMAWCLMAPSHSLKLCWPIINGVLWHSTWGNFTGSAHDINPWSEFKKFKIIDLFRRDQSVKHT